MMVIIDTSSLISLVRYYLPFDREQKLLTTIQSKVESGEMIVLDKVAEECKYLSGGIVIDKLSFLTEKKTQVKTTELFPNRKFFNMLEHQFLNPAIRRKLTDAQFETQKTGFLESADAKILLFSIEKSNNGDEVIVVTEETAANNDNKTFKKIPAICKYLGINCITLPQLLQILEGIDVSF